MRIARLTAMKLAILITIVINNTVNLHHNGDSDGVVNEDSEINEKKYT